MPCLGCFVGFFCSSKIYSGETGEYFFRVSKSQKEAAELYNALGIHATSCLHPNTYPSGPGKIWKVMGNQTPLTPRLVYFR